MKLHYLERFIEFFFIGLVMGIIEDLIAVKAVTDITITWKMAGIIALVALPFAAFSELVVDAKPLFSFFKKEVKQKKEVIGKEIREIKKAAKKKKFP